MQLLRARVEFKLPDFWIGVFWKHTTVPIIGRPPGTVNIFTDIWICLLPCLPLHLTFARRKP
jgi:hypothetical protein